MDQIIEQVLTKIRQREHQSYEVDYTDHQLAPDDTVFVNNARAVINDVTIPLLVNLYRLNLTDSWTKWILQGISYQVKFTFQISSPMVNFIPRKMLLDWPIMFVVDRKRPVVVFHHRIISRSDLAALPDHAVIVITTSQKLTDEAVQTSRYKNMILKMRTDEDCIWQK